MRQVTPSSPDRQQSCHSRAGSGAHFSFHRSPLCVGGWVLTHLQGPRLPHSSTRHVKHVSEVIPLGKASPPGNPLPQGTHLRLALNSHCKHKQCSQHPGEAISEHRHHCFWFRIEVLCLVISLQVSFQDSQDEHRVQGREGHRAWHWGLTAWCPDTR